MTTYDSDSSDAGDQYTTTNVILGYASPEASGGDEVSHIGGHPIWLDENNPPALSFSKCKNCNGYLSLLLQLNADLQQHFPHDTRRICVLSCKKRACSRKPGSIRAFREVRKPQSKKVNPSVSEHGNTAPRQSMVQAEGLGNLLFGSTGLSLNNSTNPFATSSERTVTHAISPTKTSTSTQILPPMETFAEKLKLNSSEPASIRNTTEEVEKWPDRSAFPEPYRHFYLDAYPEELDLTPASQAAEASTANAQYDAEDVGGAGVERDTFESSLDKTFQKFSDLVAQNPEQVLRYEFKGQPLLYSGADATSSRFVVPHGKAGAVKGMPRCEHCGSQRVFELQLMPYLIMEVEKDETMGIDEGMEWGTVIIGTCANNCGDDGAVTYRDEWAGIQWEERVAKK